MTPTKGFRLAEVRADESGDTTAADAFALTSRWQINQDMVEEWIACESPPLSIETRFSEFEQRDGYVFSNLGVTLSDDFSKKFSFVNHIEHKAEEIIRFYGDREHKGRFQCLAGKRCSNRVFDAMGLCYADRSGPSTSLLADDNAPRGRGGRGWWGQGRKVTVGLGANTAALESRKRKRDGQGRGLTEPADV